MFLMGLFGVCFGAGVSLVLTGPSSCRRVSWPRPPALGLRWGSLTRGVPVTAFWGFYSLPMRASALYWPFSFFRRYSYSCAVAPYILLVQVCIVCRMYLDV